MNNTLKFYTNCFYCMASWRLLKCIETKLKSNCFNLILSFFKKIKGGQELVSCLIFLIIFEEKYFSCNSLLIDQISLSGCLYFLRYWAMSILQLFVNQVVTPWILKLTLLITFPTWIHANIELIKMGDCLNLLNLGCHGECQGEEFGNLSL